MGNRDGESEGGELGTTITMVAKHFHEEDDVLAREELMGVNKATQHVIALAR